MKRALSLLICLCLLLGSIPHIALAAKVYVFSNAEESAFSAYCSLLEQEAYVGENR